MHDTDTTESQRVTAGELRAFIERVERLETEKQTAAEQQKEVFAEAKGRGYCTKTIRRLIAERKKDPSQRAEEAAVFEMYAEAVGL